MDDEIATTSHERRNWQVAVRIDESVKLIPNNHIL